MILDIQENVPLAPMTTFKIGGPARYFVVAKSEADIREALDWAKERKLRHIIWAGGSNVLVPDEGIEALVMCIENQDLSFFRNTLEADAGCNLLSLIRTASRKGLADGKSSLVSLARLVERCEGMQAHLVQRSKTLRRRCGRLTQERETYENSITPSANLCTETVFLSEILNGSSSVRSWSLSQSIP